MELERYKIWVRIGPNQTQTTDAYVWARGAYEAKQLAEAQYGQGSVLSYTLDQPAESTD
jgi:hypothetical protein